jgi:hypothetical protein
MKIKNCAFNFALLAVSLTTSSLLLADGHAPIKLGDSPTSIGFAGKIHLDVLVNADDMGNKTALSPATIPTTDSSGNMQTTLSAGQTKLKVFTSTAVDDDTVETLIEWDWYNQDNSSAFHLTQLWAEHKNLGAGQTFSVFMDISTFPNTLEYFGPNSMVFVRQPQIRYTLPLAEGQRIAFAIEKPSSAVEAGDGHESLPDITAHWRLEDGDSHIQVAGVLRQLAYTDADDDVESTLGFGLNITGNWAFSDADTLSAAFVVGEGIGRYINDSSFTNSDAVVKANGDLEALPIIGAFAFLNHDWSEQFSSSIGYGILEIDNTDDQSNSTGNSYVSFQRSNFSVVNVLYQVSAPLQVGTELQWGDFKDVDGNKGDNLRWQSSVIYRF